MEKEFDKIKEKLYNMQMPVEADVWSDIEGSLRRRRLRKVLYFASSTAAAILLALMLLVPGGKMEEASLVAQTEEISVVEEIAVEEVPQIVAETVEPSEDGSGAKPVKVLSKNIQAGAIAVVAADVDGEMVTEEVAVKEDSGTFAGAVDAKEIPAATSEEKVDEQKRVKASNISLDNYEFVDEPVKEKRRYSLALSQGIMPGTSASVSHSWIRASSAFGGAIGQSHIVEQISDTRYSLPVNLGVQLQIPLGNGAALGVGVTYSLLKSKYDCLIDKVKYDVKQRLHYIGIPLNIYGLVVDKNNFSFYVNGGISFEKGISAHYNLRSYNDAQSHSSSIKGVQFSVNAGLGVEYKFGNTVGLYFEPNLVYYTNSEVMYSIRTDQPFQVKADIGLRFHF